MSLVFRLLAQVPQALAAHQHGVQVTGELRGTAPFPEKATVTVWLSAGTGPEKPDVLGLALRVPTESGAWDLVLSSTGTGERTRMLPKFVRRWADARLGTLEPYRYRGELVWFMAVPGEGEPPARFTLHASGKDARWRQVAEVTLRPDDHATAPVAFDPVLNLPPDLALAPRRP